MWPEDPRYGVPPRFLAGLRTEITRREYTILCKKVLDSGLPLNATRLNDPKFLLQECLFTGTFSATAVKKARLSLEKHMLDSTRLTSKRPSLVLTLSPTPPDKGEKSSPGLVTPVGPANDSGHRISSSSSTKSVAPSTRDTSEASSLPSARETDGDLPVAPSITDTMIESLMIVPKDEWKLLKRSEFVGEKEEENLQLLQQVDNLNSSIKFRNNDIDNLTKALENSSLKHERKVAHLRAITKDIRQEDHEQGYYMQITLGYKAFSRLPKVQCCC